MLTETLETTSQLLIQKLTRNFLLPIITFYSDQIEKKIYQFFSIPQVIKTLNNSNNPITIQIMSTILHNSTK